MASWIGATQQWWYSVSTEWLASFLPSLYLFWIGLVYPGKLVEFSSPLAVAAHQCIIWASAFATKKIEMKVEVIFVWIKKFKTKGSLNQKTFHNVFLLPFCVFVQKRTNRFTWNCSSLSEQALWSRLFSYSVEHQLVNECVLKRQYRTLDWCIPSKTINTFSTVMPRPEKWNSHKRLPLCQHECLENNWSTCIPISKAAQQMLSKYQPWEIMTVKHACPNWLLTDFLFPPPEDEPSFKVVKYELRSDSFLSKASNSSRSCRIYTHFSKNSDAGKSPHFGQFWDANFAGNKSTEKPNIVLFFDLVFCVLKEAKQTNERSCLQATVETPQMMPA